MIYLFSAEKEKKIGSLVIDAFISEDHNFTNKIPKKKVQGAESVSDGVVKEPIIVKIKGEVNPTTADGFTQYNKPQRVYNGLRYLRDTGKAVYLVTSLTAYPNMCITSLHIPKTKDSISSFQFEATFEQVPIAKVDKITITELIKKLEEEKIIKPDRVFNLYVKAAASTTGVGFKGEELQAYERSELKSQAEDERILNEGAEEFLNINRGQEQAQQFKSNTSFPDSNIRYEAPIEQDSGAIKTFSSLVTGE